VGPLGCFERVGKAPGREQTENKDTDGRWVARKQGACALGMKTEKKRNVPSKKGRTRRTHNVKSQPAKFKRYPDNSMGGDLVKRVRKQGNSTRVKKPKKRKKQRARHKKSQVLVVLEGLT